MFSLGKEENMTKEKTEQYHSNETVRGKRKICLLWGTLKMYVKVQADQKPDSVIARFMLIEKGRFIVRLEII